jgi:hypothetical protein|nr:MAG TPA: hypothetical protein [Caudoviricetes sp.]
MLESFYWDPQDSPNPDKPDTLSLLIGRYVTNIETGTFVNAEYAEDCEKSQAILTLDDGTQLLAMGRGGGCVCGQGDFELTNAFYRGSPSARIMNAMVDMEGEEEYGGDISATAFKVFVVVDDEKLPLLEFDGCEGEGYYGRGFWLYTYPLERQ